MNQKNKCLEEGLTSDKQPTLEYHFLSRSLAEAMNALEAGNKFLKQGNIFSYGLLEQWFKVEREEVLSIGTMPHPSV